MGPDVQLIDSGSETVRDITVLLNYFDLNGEERQSLHHRFYTTGKAEDFQAIADRWLGSAKSLHSTQNYLLKNVTHCHT